MYPKWIYSSELPKGKIINSAKEEIEAGEGWFESPADIGKVKEIKKEETKKETKK